MAFALIYRLEFKNFEENTIRVDIYDSSISFVPGSSLSPATTTFYQLTGNNHISMPGVDLSFFYVGQTFTITGTASNDGTYTVTFINPPFSEIFVAEAVTTESSSSAVITDTSTTDPQVVQIQGTGTPLVISTINNDQNKFQPVRSKQAVIQLISDSSVPVDISVFSVGSDNKWKVDVSIIGIVPYVFRGFLIMSDNQQPFQPDPQTVQLTATDHLGALKDIALVDYEGVNPKGVYRIADLIMMCLRRTGLYLDLFVVNNLRVGSGSWTTFTIFASTPDVLVTADSVFFYIGQSITVTGTASNDGEYTVLDVLVEPAFTFVRVNATLTSESVDATFTETISSSHFYDIVRIDAKSCEKEIGLCEDSYTVLSKILGEDCYVCQWAGAWWIMRVDEFNSFDIYTAHFDNIGQYVGIDTVGTNYNISIGATETRRFANADTLLQFIRPHQFVELDYPFALPLEIPDNVDLERGALTNDVSPSEKHYALDDWQLLYNDAPNFPPTTAGITYLRRDFINDTEVKRYVVMEVDPLSHLNFIMSNPIPVNALDKFVVGLSQRFSANVGGSGAYAINILQVRLYGNEGSFWTCQNRNDITDLVPVWVPCTSTFETDQKFFQYIGDLGSTDFTNAQSLYNGESAEIPVEGFLRILVYAAPFAVDTYTDKVTFDYIPYINGSYRKYSSDAYRVDRTQTGYMAKRQQDVHTEDGPNRLTKGAMQFVGRFQEIVGIPMELVGPNFILIPGDYSGSFYVGQVLRIGNTSFNNQITVITAVTYHLIPDETELSVMGIIVSESVAAILSTGFLTLTKNWYSAQPLALALNTDQDNIHSYGYIQIFSVWNQFRGSDDGNGDGMGINIFTGSVLGLTTDWPDLLHKYLLTDANGQTNNRYFMLLSMSQDWKSCIWTATLAEVFNTVAGRNYDDPETFKYISE